MNVRYLKWLIRDQIDRARSLKDAIPDKQKHAALEQLASACRDRLDEQVSLLKECCGQLDSSDMKCAASILKSIKYCSMAIAAVEGYGLPPLHCQSKEAVFLNDVLSAMHHEAGLSYRRPAVSCTSSEYYFSHLSTNTVYVPLSEAAFLLHMPDFYHELGHILFDSLDYGAEYEPIKTGVTNTTRAINAYYTQQANKAERDASLGQARSYGEWAWTRWTTKWIQESFCDLFALFAAGPAYAYSNLHIVSKMDINIYVLNIHTKQSHPPSEFRMRLLDAGMRLLGHERKADHVKEEWDSVAHLYGSPPPWYGHIFPPCLLHEIAAAVLPTFGQAGLRGYAENEQQGGGADGTPIAALLNDAWRVFWRDGDVGFRSAERSMVARLASIARGHCSVT